MAVTGVDHADAAAEIDQPVAIGIGDDRALGVHHGDRGHGGHPPGHRLGPPRQQSTAFGPGISVWRRMTPAMMGPRETGKK